MGGHLDPAVASARNLVRDALSDLAPGARVAVGLSGGADSLALAAAVAFVAPRAGFVGEAVVVDHGLQHDSAGIAARAARQAASLGLAARVVSVSVTPGAGPEAAARAARYAAFETLAADVVLLAHTLDDQAETVLLGLGRGSGPRSIAGMAPVAGRLRRPFLTFTRADTETVCRASGLAWWDDPHNVDPAYRRVRVRRELLPLMEDVLAGGVAAALARTAALVRADNDYLDALAAAVDVTTVAEIGALAPAIRTRVLRRKALEAGASADQLSHQHVTALDALVTTGPRRGHIDLPGGVVASRTGDSLRFGPRAMAG